jgi:GTPase
MDSAKRKPVIAVDGPAGVGKSTIAIALARELGLTYVETGALYRAVGLAAERAGADLECAAVLGAVAAGMEVVFRFQDDVNHVFLDGEDVTDLLRSPEMGTLASKVSAVPEVRAALLELQRDFGRAGGAVAEGRDIGTVVFPDADYKFFLVADPEERARRRHLQLQNMGEEVDFDGLLAEIKERDHQDSTRAIAPLKAADDAIVVDTTSLQADEVTRDLLARVRRKVQVSTREYRSGFVCIVGRPNVGKSTLMNSILGTKIAIVSPRPQTTRNKITGIATYDDCQIVWLDTPGIHEGKGSLNRLMLETAWSSLTDADAICYLVDASDAAKRGANINRGDLAIMEQLRASAKPAVLVLNKMDLVKKHKLLPVIEAFSAEMSFTSVVPASALSGDGVDAVLQEVRVLMPPGERYYKDGELTDRSRNFIITEFIREKVFLATRQEVPYSTAVSVDLVTEREEGKPLLHIITTIHVERKSQKGIIIGKQGQMVKEIGTQARVDLEAYFGKRIFLELHVRVEKEWTRSLKGIRKVGFET